jgi:hypothetical protein
VNWRPNISGAGIIADMTNARLPYHTIAAALGIKQEVFEAWAIKTASAVAPPDEPPEDDDWQPEAKQKQPSPKIMAERMFSPALCLAAWITHKTALERAFDIAGSGRCINVN